MIKFLRIQNILSHKDTRLKLSPGVNAIIGISESGKSTVLRALRLLGFNRPLGMEYQSHWGGEMRVSVTLMNGTKIVRGHSKKQNYYSLQQPEEEEPQLFKSFKGDVPDPIRQALPLSPDCFHRQHDSPFLIGTEYSPADVARHFNRVAGIEDIDVSQKNLRTWSGRLNTELQHVSKDLQQYEAEQEEMKYLPQMEEDTLFLKEILREVDQNERTVVELHKLQDEAKKITKEEEEIEDLKPLEEEYDRLERSVTAIKKAQRERLPLLELQRNLKKGRDQAQEVEESLSKKERQLHELMPEVCPLCDQPTSS